MTLESTERPEPADAATLAAAEGQAALGRGDTAAAAARFVEAGEILLREAAGQPDHGDKTLLRFLAASQFYKGGAYGRALELARRVEARILPSGSRGLLPRFLKDAGERAAPDYRERMRQALFALYRGGQYRRVMDLLKDHPYVYDPGPLAFLRAVLCEELGLWRAAASFYAKALPTAKDGSDFVLLAVGRALVLPAQGRTDEAWEYVSRLRELMPGAVTNLTASYVLYCRANAQAVGDRLALHREQLASFDAGLSDFEALPPGGRNHPELRAIVSVAVDAALMASMRLGEKGRARGYAERVMRLDPDSPGPLTVRGMLDYPSAAAVADFERAAALANPGYAPFLYLAHHAFSEDRFGDAVALCERALAGNPGRPVAAQLVCWIAVCRHYQGASAEEVEGWFRRAQEIDAGNAQVQANYEAFRETIARGQKVEKSRWETWLGDEREIPSPSDTPRRRRVVEEILVPH
ncbi:MAG TPA: hypothetical protein VD866_21355 [Urbifossiella sp.]|nr:hypothetical protein [Urbifossiella sp.]